MNKMYCQHGTDNSNTRVSDSQNRNDNRKGNLNIFPVIDDHHDQD